MKLRIRRIFSAVLACILLTACTGGREEADPAVPETETEVRILTHVFREEALPVPEGYRCPEGMMPYVTESGRLRYYCETDIQDGEGGVSCCIYETDTDGSDPVVTEMVLPEGMKIANGTFSEENAVFLSRNYDAETGRASVDLHIYRIADGGMVTVNSVEYLFPDTVSKRNLEITGIETDKNGCIYIAANEAVCIMNPEGIKLFDFAPSEYNKGIFRGTDGFVYVMDMVKNGYVFRRLDTETGDAAENLYAPDDQADTLCFGPDYPLYYSNEVGLYGFSEEEEKHEIVLNWNNSDLISGNYRQIRVISKDLVLTRYGSVLRRIPDIDLSAIAVVELAYVGGDLRFKEDVIAFNRSQNGIRVEFCDYSIYNSKENDQTGGVTRLLNDILNGMDVPDLVYDNGPVRDILMEKGLFRDLYPYLEQDENLRAENIIGCIKNIFDADGRLAALCRDFSIETWLAASDSVDGKTSWTLSEMLDTALALEDGKRLMADLHQGNAVDKLLGKDAWSEFVDMTNLTCDFHSDTFLKLLRYIETLPTEAESGSSGKNEYESYQTGEILLYPITYYRPEDIFVESVVFNTEDVVRIGYPVRENGDPGIRISGKTAAFMIPTEAEHTEEAWAYISFLLRNAEANTVGSGRRGLNTVKERIEEAALWQKDTRYFYRFSGGTTAWSGDFFTVETGVNGVNYLNGKPGIMVQYDQNKMDAFLDWLDTVGSPFCNSVHDEVSAIVEEEISGYLGGARSAEETADIIQSRVSIWLAERK